MGKGANKQLLANAGVGQQQNKALSGQAESTYGFLDPTLRAEATNPQGYGAADLASMNTASQQSLGGSTAGVTGQANLEAARTRNAGGFQGAAASGARNAQKQLSQNAVEIQANNARLKEQQKQTALSSLERLYGIDQATALQYLNTSNSALEGENRGSANSFGANFFSVLGKNAANNLNGSNAGAGMGE